MTEAKKQTMGNHFKLNDMNNNNFNSQHEYYYERKNKKMIDFYQFFKVIGAVSGLILIASFIYQIFEK